MQNSGFKTFLVLLILASRLSAQEALKSTEEEYYDFLSLTGVVERPTLGYRTLSDSEWHFNEDEEGNSLADSEENIWRSNNLGTKYILWESESAEENWFTRGIEKSVKFKAFGPEWYNSYNTAAPYGQNDGALWQGKGYNTSFTAGARLEGYGFEVTLKPEISFSQNKEFDLMPSAVSSPYGYYQSGIDAPQRFGDSSIKTFDWGDSEVRWSWHTLTFGAGFQSPWLGSAWLNPMLGSNNAATYPKIDAGLRKTSIFMPHFGWYIGDIEGRLWLGRLTESDYFDNNPDNDYRLLTAMSASFAPSFVPGLTVGLNRIFITDFASHNLKYIGRLFTLSHSNGSQVGNHEDEDQKVAIFANWKFPKVGFEVWGELGIDDFTSDKLANPFHTAIYSVGLKQATPLPLDWLKGEIIAEWNNFEMSQDFQLQWCYTGYYSHGRISQGYTNKGQILGAGSGSMGNCQFLGYKLYHPHGNVMLFYHRYCPDNNYIYNKAVDTDASSDSKTSTVNKDYYGRFKVFRSYGINLTQYVTKSLFINTSLTRVFMARQLYNTSNVAGFSVCISTKYNF
ncbi:hypothetical protein DYE50_04725 [Treponema ruminis]|uniref:Capsule assembly protein Wzi n=1 Tax=Treponema ruminis TaxID=744515 RepID=A0A7W8G7H6_9SPIR|nr:capsule assembly Wzi family protein [Treponema ruminis]MBB5225251.1 hypothetical protein [Treponema ruminis]QSI01878.1 hypothetical protein DYE50_04725 [Treponema ruminis]